MADQLGRRDVITVFDQAIYAEAIEIVWGNHQQFQRVVLRWEYSIRFALSLLQLARGSPMPGSKTF